MAQPSTFGLERQGCLTCPPSLPRRERRSIADIVERALEAREVREAGREPDAAFYAGPTTKYGTGIGLEAVIREARRMKPGPDV